MLLKWVANFIVEYLPNQARSCVRNVSLWYELLGLCSPMSLLGINFDNMISMRSAQVLLIS